MSIPCAPFEKSTKTVSFVQPFHKCVQNAFHASSFRRNVSSGHLSQCEYDTITEARESRNMLHTRVGLQKNRFKCRPHYLLAGEP